MPYDIDLNQRWLSLTSSFNVDARLSQTEFDRIARAYGEKHRAYHNLTHLQHFYSQLDSLNDVTPAMEFALFYHDVVYKPGKKSNEENSANWAHKTLSNWQIDQQLVGRVCQLISCTGSHRINQDDRSGAEFLDADMAILGSPWDQYQQYAHAIRQEHKRYPDFLYNSGRKQFLTQTLAHPRLFISEHFNHLYEQKSRENITNELNLLD